MAVLWLLVPGVPMICYGLAATFNLHGLASHLARRGVIPLLLPPGGPMLDRMLRGVGTARLTRIYRMGGLLYVALGQLALSAVGIGIGGPVGVLLIVLTPVVGIVSGVVRVVGVLRGWNR